MVFFIPVQRSQQPSSACPWLHAGPATKRHCGSPPPKRGRDLISPRPSEHRLLQLRHLGCCECFLNHEARTFKLLQANDLNLKWSQNVLTHALHEVAPSGFLAWIWKTQIHYIYIYILYSTIISFTISFKGRDWDCSSFTLNNYQTYFPICSRAKRRMSKKKQAHLNHGTSRSCDETVVWQSLKLLNKSSERKPASRITTRRCRVAI